MNKVRPPKEVNMVDISTWPVPQNVESQTNELLSAGVVDTLGGHMAPGVDAARDYEFWSFVHLDLSHRSMLYFMGQPRDGVPGPEGRVSRFGTEVAFNHLGRLTGAGSRLTIKQLSLLERLAVGPEDFDLQPGLVLRRTATPLLDFQNNRRMPPGEECQVKAVHLGWVEFYGLRHVMRRAVTSTYFSA